MLYRLNILTIIIYYTGLPTQNATLRRLYWNYTFCFLAVKMVLGKVIMQGKLFQRCTQCTVSVTRRISKPDNGIHLSRKNQWNILVIGNYNVNYQNYQNLMLLTSSDNKRTLMHLLLFTNSAQRELVLIFTQSILFILNCTMYC